MAARQITELMRVGAGKSNLSTGEWSKRANRKNNEGDTRFCLNNLEDNRTMH
jgi:hypothetical protein